MLRYKCIVCSALAERKPRCARVMYGRPGKCIVPRLSGSSSILGAAGLGTWCVRYEQTRFPVKCTPSARTAEHIDKGRDRGKGRALVGTGAHGYHGIAPWNGLDDPFAALIARYIFAARYARLINEFPFWRSNNYA